MALARGRTPLPRQLLLLTAPFLRTSATPPTIVPSSYFSSVPRSFSSSSSSSSLVSPSRLPSSGLFSKVSHLASRAGLVSRHFVSTSPSSSPSPSHSSPTMSFAVRKIAQPNTLEHRVYIEKDGVPVSPFHDVPLYANEDQTILNMIVEIPRWTNAKVEVWLTVHCPGDSASWKIFMSLDRR